MPKVKILFLTQVLPYPLVGGAKIRAYYMLRQLTIRHEVTLLSFTRGDDRPSDIAHLSEFCHAVHAVPMERSRWRDAAAAGESMLRDTPLVVLRDKVPAMEDKIGELMATRNFDIIHADQTSMAYYALLAKKWSRHEPRPKLVLDQHNAMYKVVQRQSRYERGWVKQKIWQREAERLARYEAGLIREFNQILTVTAEDQAALLDLLPEAEAARRSEHFTVVPICVDPAEQPLIARMASQPQILHLGTMFWPPNIEGVLWFAEKALPRIVIEVPGVKFIIAGKNPPKEIIDLGHPTAQLAGHIEVPGFVADPYPLLAESKVFIVPLLAGGGMRVKILDGWQWGIPIVSTTIGAEGINSTNGENILLADDPEVFASRVIDILKRPELERSLIENGRRVVENEYNWRKVYPKIDDIFYEIIKAPE